MLVPAFFLILLVGWLLDKMFVEEVDAAPKAKRARSASAPDSAASRRPRRWRTIHARERIGCIATTFAGGRVNEQQQQQHRNVAPVAPKPDFATAFRAAVVRSLGRPQFLVAFIVLLVAAVSLSAATQYLRAVLQEGTGSVGQAAGTDSRRAGAVDSDLERPAAECGNAGCAGDEELHLPRLSRFAWSTPRRSPRSTATIRPPRAGAQLLGRFDRSTRQPTSAWR